VGNKAKDKPLKDFQTVNGSGKRSQGLKSCQLYDGGGGDDDDDRGNRIFKLSSLHPEHDLWGTQPM